MEIRKIQKVGTSTLSISLPSNWVKENNLKRGDHLYLESDEDGSLKIFLNKSIELQQQIPEYVYNSDLFEEPRMLQSIIVGSYILGRDLFSITSSKRFRSEYVNEIRGVVPKLIGLGIVEETSKSITIQCSVDPRKFQLDMLLRRLSVISLTVVKEATQALVESNPTLAKDAISRENEADRMYLLALRLLISAQRKKQVAKEIGLKDQLHVLYFGLMLRYLEMISDYGEEIARRAIELIQKYKDKLPNWVIERVEKLNELAYDLILKSVSCFFTEDIKIANSMLDVLSVIEFERDKLMKELPEIPHLRLILWNINRIADNGANIALIAINNSLERKNEICLRQFKKT
ncbi:MAG: phosphate uptake regulator PhoU [Candidatus Bathyarchaeota archaeon]|nr:phosphate uptake regulator PhoU [Candidatus Bathyarchaeota archaeon]